MDSLFENQLLGALPEAVLKRLLPYIRPVNLTLGEVLYESGDPLSYVYFPISSIISLLYVMENGDSAEIAVIGNEGFLGIAVLMGGDSTISRAVVQSAGLAFRVPAKQFKEEFHRDIPTLHLLLRYSQALLTQMTQTAACNRHHSIDQQLCRWLLLSLDRLSSNQLFMTHELISNMLGVRREGVTAAAGKLQKAGIISYSRGRVTVLERAQLELACCECYAVVKRESARLLPVATADQATRKELELALRIQRGHKILL